MELVVNPIFVMRYLVMMHVLKWNTKMAASYNFTKMSYTRSPTTPQRNALALQNLCSF